LQLHQALGSEADHFAQKIGVGALFQKRAKGHHLVGHRWILGSVAWFSDQTLPMIRDDHRKPLAHYGAPQGRARSRLAPPSYTTSRDATGFRGMDKLIANLAGICSATARHNHAPWLWSLDATGAGGRGQCRHDRFLAPIVSSIFQVPRADVELNKAPWL